MDNSSNTNWFKKHPVLTVFLGIILFGTVVSAFNSGDSDPRNAVSNIQSSASSTLAPLPRLQTPTPTYQAPQPKGEVNYYTNTAGNKVQSPTYYDSRPAGASAKCRDGTYSFSQNRRGTCSHHGGVAQWY